MKKVFKIIGIAVVIVLIGFLSYQYALVLLRKYQIKIAESVTQLNQQEIWNTVYKTGSISIQFPQLNEKGEVIKDKEGNPKFIPVQLVPVQSCGQLTTSTSKSN